MNVKRPNQIKKTLRHIE